MEDAVIILADFVLQKCPIGKPFRVRGPLQEAMLELQEKYSPEITAKIREILISQSSVVRDFLLAQKYLNVIEASTHLDQLNDKGEEARRAGGHEKYLAHLAKLEKEKEEEAKAQKRMNFPQKYWWIMLIIGWFGGCWSDIGKEALKRKIWPDTSLSQPSTPQKGDIVYPKPDSSKLKGIK